MQIGIFSKGSREFGTGHLVRCQRIAAQLNKNGYIYSLFFDFPPELSHIINAQSNVIQLPAFNEFVINQATQQLTFDTVIYDALTPDLNIINCLQQRCQRLIILDWQPTAEELVNIKKPTLIVNGITGELFPNQECFSLADGVKVYQGIQYAILDPKIQQLRAQHQPKQHRLLVFMGGSDPNNWTSQLLNDANELFATILQAGFEIEFIVGNYSQASSMLENNTSIQQLISSKSIKLVQNPPDFLERLNTSSAILTCGGITMFEALALGVFPVVLPQVEVQIPASQQLAERNLAILVSTCRTLDKKSLSFSLQQLVSAVLHDQELATKLQLVVDGNGLNRFINLIVNKDEGS